MKIVTCNNPICCNLTLNPKFCSKHCAAVLNNNLFPKRRPSDYNPARSRASKPYQAKITTKTCKRCEKVFSGNRSQLCLECNQKYVDWNKRTIADIRKTARYQVHAAIRNSARISYRRSKRFKICAICKYSKHVDICHIKDIQHYDITTPISVVNSHKNLIALCKNHHWEFDYDLL